MRVLHHIDKSLLKYTVRYLLHLVHTYPIYFFETDTSGEKTYEEFYTEEEDFEINEYDSLGYINNTDIEISFEEVVADFDSVFNNSNPDKLDIINVINKYVPDFIHIETGKHLDQKM